MLRRRDHTIDIPCTSPNLRSLAVPHRRARSSTRKTQNMLSMHKASAYGFEIVNWVCDRALMRHRDIHIRPILWKDKENQVLLLQDQVSVWMRWRSSIIQVKSTSYLFKKSLTMTPDPKYLANLEQDNPFQYSGIIEGIKVRTHKLILVSAGKTISLRLPGIGHHRSRRQV